MLLEAGAKPTAKTLNDATRGYGNIKIIKFVNDPARIKAAEQLRTDIVKILLKAGAYTNIQIYGRSRSLADLATQKGLTEIAKLLKKKQAKNK